MRIRLSGLILLLAALGGFSGSAFAQEGVGVNVGKIQVDEPVAPGGTYHIPSVGVINTGHDPSDYSLRIIYQHEQEEEEPPEEWFTFHPDRFRLEPGQLENVRITLKLPLTARPGDYFAFLEAYSVRDTEQQGGVALSVAAATRLNFTVEPSNVFSGAFLWVLHHFRDWSPWSYTVLGIVLASVAGFLIIKVFKVRIKLERA